MSVDISSLKLKKLDQTDWEDYPVGGAFLPPVEPGIYPLRIKKWTFEAKDGFLTGIVDLALDQPTEGRAADLRDWIGTKPRDKGRRKGTCKAGDFLLAVGSEEKPGTEPQEWADALAATDGALIEAKLDWSCYDGEAQKELAGSYEEFPVDPQDPSKRLPYVVVTAADGTTKRMTARQRVAFYIIPKA